MNAITHDAVITNRGRELAWKLNPALGSTVEIDRTCSLIVRHARTYNRIQEVWCSVELSDRATAQLERREALLEQRLTDLVDWLPWTDDGAITVKFDGDPRGHCVKLVMPGQYERLHDDWGREGIGADVGS